MFDSIKRLFAPKPERRGITWNQAANAGILDTPTLSGVHVNETSALALSTVYRAARVVSESVGTMPLKLYRSSPEGRTEAREHPLWSILHDSPNAEQSAVDFFTLLQWWAVLHGNAYAELERDGSGAVIALWPIPPWTVQPTRTDDGKLVYEVDGKVIIDAEDIVHLKGPSPDGSQGYKLTQLARESLGLSLSLDKFGAAYFGNSCKVGGVLKTAGQLNETARENLRKSWSLSYAGVENVGKVPVLEDGLDFVPFAISNQEGQYLESRQYQILEICRYIGVDPIFVYEYGKATWNNAEAQTRNFLQFSLNFWLRKLESELSRKVISPSERSTIYPEFVRESIIQMDAKTQAEVWKTGVEGGWYQPDEIRKWLNLAPLPKPVTPAPVTSLLTKGTSGTTPVTNAV